MKLCGEFNKQFVFKSYHLSSAFKALKHSMSTADEVWKACNENIAEHQEEEQKQYWNETVFPQAPSSIHANVNKIGFRKSIKPSFASSELRMLMCEFSNVEKQPTGFNNK